MQHDMDSLEWMLADIQFYQEVQDACRDSISRQMASRQPSESTDDEEGEEDQPVGLQAPITGAGKRTMIRVIREGGPGDGPTEFVLDIAENGSGGFISVIPGIYEEPVTWHRVELDDNADDGYTE